MLTLKERITKIVLLLPSNEDLSNAFNALQNNVIKLYQYSARLGVETLFDECSISHIKATEIPTETFIKSLKKLNSLLTKELKLQPFDTTNEKLNIVTTLFEFFLPEP